MNAPDEPSTAALLDGRYQLGECIGQGGMARVYRAEDVILGRTVAIKMMRTDADELSIPPRARTEMALLASLNHPSLVTLFDASIVPGRPEYLVMELVDGTSLAHALHAGPLDAAEVAGIAGELASALHVVHAAGIVHRDVKPSNVLLAHTPRPARAYLAKLADFGVAYLVDSTRLTSPGMVMGTAAYLAPEQVRGEAAGTPADIYALGLLLLEALTGERAFPEASGIGQVMARLVETPAVPEWVGPEWTSLLASMLARDPAARPGALDVAHASAELPTRLERPAVAPAPTPTAPPRPASTLDQVTQPYTPTDGAPVAPAPPLTRADAAPRRRRRRRPLSHRITLIGVASVAALGLVIGGHLWAGGLTGPTGPELTVPQISDPAPTLEVEQIADEDDVVEPLVSDGVSEGETPADDDAAPQKTAVPAPADTTTPRKSEPGSQAARDAAKAEEKAARESRKAEQKAASDAEKKAKAAERESSGNGNGNGKGNGSGSED